MWDLERDEPFVARALHRFGTRRSAPVDNYSKGGLAATVDLETGELGAAITAPSIAGPRHYTSHPDTGAPIAGIPVPRFADICDAVLDLNRHLPHIPYIGWDVLVGDDQWWIIEGNHFPDTQMIQAFGPLLVDPRIRRFYEHHHVVRC